MARSPGPTAEHPQYHVSWWLQDERQRRVPLRPDFHNFSYLSTKMICIIPKAAHRQMPSICGLGLTRGIGIGVETR